MGLFLEDGCKVYRYKTGQIMPNNKAPIPKSALFIMSCLTVGITSQKPQYKKIQNEKLLSACTEYL